MAASPFRGSPLVRTLVALLTICLLVAMWWAARRDAGAVLGRARLLCFAGYATFALTMLAVAIIDLATGLIPDAITLPGTIVFYGLSLTRPDTGWSDGLLGAAIGYALPLGVYAHYRLRGYPDSFGLGLVKLLGLVGAYLGWQGALASFFGGGFVGVLAVSVWVVVRQAKGITKPITSQTQMEFGPCLAAAAVGWILFAPYLRQRLF